MYKVGNIVKQIQRKQKIFLNLFFKSCILTNGRSLGPGEEIILFFMPKILTSGSLKYLEIPLVVLYRPVLYKTTLRVSFQKSRQQKKNKEKTVFQSSSTLIGIAPI